MKDGANVCVNVCAAVCAVVVPVPVAAIAPAAVKKRRMRKKTNQCFQSQQYKKLFHLPKKCQQRQLYQFSDKSITGRRDKK
jgi:hypothetical protein